jgi:hypothetical protein
MHGGQIAIIGASETDEIGVLPDRAMIGLHAEAALNALADAGLTAADVDGVATAGPLPLEVSHHLGITPRWLDGTLVGGCSFMLHVRHAAASPPRWSRCWTGRRSPTPSPARCAAW